MNIEQFWQFIERTHAEAKGVPELQFELLIQALIELSEKDIKDCDRILRTLMNRAYTTDVWNAAYIITSCSDDSFMDFRGWLIAQGKTIYENVLHEPDSLADIVTVEDREQYCWEGLAYITYYAYERKTGTEEGIPGQVGFHPVLTGKLPLSNPDESYQIHYPKLWAKFGWMWRTVNDENAEQPA